MMLNKRNIPKGLDSHDANVQAADMARSDRDQNILFHCEVVRRITEWKKKSVAGFDDAQRPEIEKFGEDVKTRPRGQKPLYRSLVWTQLVCVVKFCIFEIVAECPQKLPGRPWQPSGHMLSRIQQFHRPVRCAAGSYVQHMDDGIHRRTLEVVKEIYSELGPSELGPHRGVLNLVPQHAEQMRADVDAIGGAPTMCPMKYSANGVWTAKAMAQWLTTHPRVLELQAIVLDFHQAQLDKSILHCNKCEEAVEFTSTEYRKVFLMGAMFNQLSIEPPMDEDVQV